MSKTSPNRIAIKIKPAAERMVKKRHPWIFEGSITKQSGAGEAGDLAIIFDQKKNKFLACGFYDPTSPIRIKLLQYHKSANIDTEWFDNKIKVAFALRQELLSSDTNSYRLIFGEGDGLPGFIADVYDSVLVIKLYSAIWLPYFESMLDSLQTVSECSTVVLRLSRNLQRSPLNTFTDGQVLRGALEKEEVVFKEHGILFSANVVQGHKTGFFLDHRHNRLKIGSMAKGKKVLDVFSYAGGFSIHALVGGAKEVTSIDISKKALMVAKTNAELNKPKGIHICKAADAFEELESLAQNKIKFDIVVIDPPSFAKQASEIPVALNQYKRLALLGARLVARDGILFLASCSSRVSADDFFQHSLEGIEMSNISFQVIEKTYHDIDHPITFPEGAYLKGFYLVQN